MEILDDEAIIGLFFARDEAAISATDKKYGRQLGSLSRNITGDEQDAEECVNDTYLKVWELIPPEHPERYFAYLCRIVRLISLDAFDRRHAQKRRGGVLELTDELADCIPGSDGRQDADDAALAAALDRFIRSLDGGTARIFLRRYYYADGIERISGLTHLSGTAVKSRLFRARKQLRAFLEKEGFDI